MNSIVKNDRSANQAARFDVETNMMPAVGQHGMFMAIGVDGKREPRRQLIRDDAIGIAGVRWHRRDEQGARIIVGVPDDPRIRGCEVRTFGESEVPTGSDR